MTSRRAAPGPRGGTTPPHLRLVTAPGLAGAAAGEVSALLGLPARETGPATADVGLPPGDDDTLLAAARVTLASRAAGRVVLDLARDIPAEPDALAAALRDLPWEDWLPVGVPFAVRATGRSPALRHTLHVARLAKDAVRDRFRARGRQAPPVDPRRPRALLDVAIRKGRCSVGLDLGGGSLHYRGGRRDATAPLREDVAAGLALLAGVRADRPLLDPFCGSGTLLAEAAAVALGLPAARDPRRLALGALLPFRDVPLAELAEELASRRPPGDHAPFLGADADAVRVAEARALVARAGLGGHVEVREASVEALEPPENPGARPGIVLTNPPWGRRLAGTGVRAAWRALGTLARRLPGWTLAVLSGDPALTRELGLAAGRRHPVLVGGVDARFLLYPLRSR